jgi:hypothetical protein
LVSLSSEKPKAISNTASEIVVNPAPVASVAVPEPTPEVPVPKPAPVKPKPKAVKPTPPPPVKPNVTVDASAEEQRIGAEAETNFKLAREELTKDWASKIASESISSGGLRGYGLIKPHASVPAPERPVVPASPPPVYATAAAPYPAPAPVPVATASSYSMLPYRELIKAADIDKESNDLVSFVLFVNKPVDEATKSRYVDVCKYWEASLNPLTKAEKVALASEGVRTTPMYWLTHGSLKPDDLNCGNLYAYDFDAAAKISIPLQADIANSSGPFLVLVRNKVHQHLVLDISKFSPPDIQRAFDTWRSQVCKEDPMSGAKLAKFREYFRALVQDYGESILKVMEGG